jgi:Flp pilus assembly protein TadG
MVTAELAACLPVLVLLLAVAVSAVSVAGQQVRAQDAAYEVARAAARDADLTGRQLAAQYAPGATVEIRHTSTQVVADVRVSAHMLASWLPAVTIHARAVAAPEPEAGATPTPVAGPP